LFAIIECSVVDTDNRVGEPERRELNAKREGGFPDVGDGVGDINPFQTATILKSVGRNADYTGFNYDHLDRPIELKCERAQRIAVGRLSQSYESVVFTIAFSFIIGKKNIINNYRH
jgi:hypothetical protein